ncbi:hypothetical protein ES288_D07G167700v1, partial [Gossypium darwinii]
IWIHTVDDETHSFFRIVVLKSFSIKDFRCCLEDARELFDKMPEKGCLPNEFSSRILVHGYCRFGLANKGLELLDEMRSSGIFPNKLCKTGDIEKLVERMREDGVRDVHN